MTWFFVLPHAECSITDIGYKWAQEWAVFITTEHNIL